MGDSRAKRPSVKAWWLGVGIAVLLAGMVSSLFLREPSELVRLERVLDGHGFERAGELPGELKRGSRQRRIQWITYIRPKLSGDDTSALADEFRGILDGFEYSQEAENDPDFQDSTDQGDAPPLRHWFTNLDLDEIGVLDVMISRSRSWDGNLEDIETIVTIYVERTAVGNWVYEAFRAPAQGLVIGQLQLENSKINP